MKLAYLALAILMFTACANKKLETFSFHSNMNNVYIAIDEQSCYTPCELTVMAGKAASVTVGHSPELQFHMKADKYEESSYSGSSSNSGDWIGSGFNIGNVSGGGGDAEALAILLLASTSTTLVVVTTGIIIEATEQSSVTVWKYDTRAYYIYLSDPSAGYALPESTLTDFVLRNFPQMQQEAFYEAQPHIDALAEVSMLPKERLQELLVDAQPDSAVSFLDDLIREKAKEILNIKQDKQDTIEAIAKLLSLDIDAAKSQFSLYNHFINAEFSLKLIDDYLREKRTILDLKN
ncbi:MAG: hypothetical protein LBV04_06365 [Deferribacteraceae bacterium]|jgi:hypothetical protein|nr:hypothetical protein [Deferribacteraceae bacterium]